MNVCKTILFLSSFSFLLYDKFLQNSIINDLMPFFFNRKIALKNTRFHLVKAKLAFTDSYLSSCKEITNYQFLCYTTFMYETFIIIIYSNYFQVILFHSLSCIIIPFNITKYITENNITL